MSGEFIIFSILAFSAIICGVLMLNLTKVVHMVISLVFTFLSIAGLFVMLSAEFVAVVQVLVYSGAVTIIMLFGIMLTRYNDKSEQQASKLKLLLVGSGVAAFFITVYAGINDLSLGEQATDLHVNNTQNIGIELYSKYVIPFELTSVVLLVALIGAIILAKRDDDEEAERK